MKSYSNIIILIVLFSICKHTQAQHIQWNKADSTRHIISANVGWDYSFTYGVAYNRKVMDRIPTYLAIQSALPIGGQRFDDIKSKIGVQSQLLDISGFVLGASVFGVYRRYENDLVRMQNFGSDFRLNTGYYGRWWSIGMEGGFDKAIVTHFKHSQLYKDDFYTEVRDGWLEPPTGGNFYYGLHLGLSLDKSDITLNGGKVIAENLKNTPLIPFYFNLGFNYRW